MQQEQNQYTVYVIQISTTMGMPYHEPDKSKSQSPIILSEGEKKVVEWLKRHRMVGKFIPVI